MLLSCDSNAIVRHRKTAEITSANTTGMNTIMAIHTMSTTRPKIKDFLLLETTNFIPTRNECFDRDERGFRNYFRRCFEKCYQFISVSWLFHNSKIMSQWRKNILEVSYCLLQNSLQVKALFPVNKKIKLIIAEFYCFKF